MKFFGDGYIFCLNSEQSVLGILILDCSYLDKIFNLLCIEDFYFKNHKTIFSAIIELINSKNSFDIIDIYNKSNNIDYNYLNILIQKAPNPSNIIHYVNVIYNMSIIRKLLFVIKNLISDIYKLKNNNVEDFLIKVESDIYNISKYYFKNKFDILLMSSIFNNVLNEIKLLYNGTNNLNNISTGFTELDNILSGLHKGELIIVAGRPSMGKTTFCMNIAQHIVFKIKLPVIIFSLEMTAYHLVIRILSSLTNLDQQLLRNGNLSNNDLNKIRKIIDKIYSVKLFIDESPNLTTSEIYFKSKKIINKYGKLGIIIVDYLQLMNSLNPNYNRVMEISEISRSLKCLARDLDIPVFVVSQLNRSLELRCNKRPIMSDLRESGAIEQDADIVLFIYRDEIYNPHTINKGVAEIIIAKQRNGPVGIINLLFISENLKFKNFKF